jgi:hypothetical protein
MQPFINYVHDNQPRLKNKYKIRVLKNPLTLPHLYSFKMTKSKPMESNQAFIANHKLEISKRVHAL